MHREGSFSYFDGGTFQALEIPYKSKELSIIIFLPKDRSGLPHWNNLSLLQTSSNGCTS